MNKKNLFFAALFLAALVFGFSACENPNGDLLNNGGSITDNDSTTNNPDQGGDNNGGNTKPTTPEVPTMVATGGASDVEYSTITLWGRINTDTLWAFPNIKWGIECSTSKEEMQQHKGKKALCTTDLVGENSDEYSVAFTEVGYGKMLYYNAYLLINNMKYIYGEVDSVHLDVKLTVNRNNTSYGTVTGSDTYDHLAEVTITATPKENYYFTSWSDGNTDNPRTVVVNSDTTFTANFTLKPYLTVKSNNTSYGTVTGSGYYMPGDEVTITATLKDNCFFTGWSDCDSKELTRTITLTSDSTITAKFAKNPYLTVETNNSDYGTVTGSGYYIPGEEVTITATPKPGFKFVKWNDSNTDNTRIITMGYVNVTYTATFEVSPNNVISGTENGYDYVDLGLPSGLKWATCNVGATTPIGYGNYYAWGETLSTKTTYNWSTYKWCNGSRSTLTKYNTSRSYGTVDNKTVLEPEDDAARANWGGQWRMPTDAEWTELRENCTWTWTTKNGVNGYEVKGTNGNSIFLPAAGFRYRTVLNNADSEGYYWSSSLLTDYPVGAWYVHFFSGNVGSNSYYRYYGQSVRPVLGE